MGIAIVFIIVLLLLSFIAMVVSIGFDKPSLMDFFLFGVYGAWSGGACVKFYKHVIKLNSYGKYGTFI